jgi:hypothetical protein
MPNAECQMPNEGNSYSLHLAFGVRHSAFLSLDSSSTGPVTLWVTGWKKSFIERWSLAVPMVALMWAGNPIKTLLPVQIPATIFSVVRFREDLGSMLAA